MKNKIEYFYDFPLKRITTILSKWKDKLNELEVNTRNIEQRFWIRGGLYLIVSHD